jgi:hypothetical protein
MEILTQDAYATRPHARIGLAKGNQDHDGFDLSGPTTLLASVARDCKVAAAFFRFRNVRYPCTPRVVILADHVYVKR